MNRWNTIVTILLISVATNTHAQSGSGWSPSPNSGVTPDVSAGDIAPIGSRANSSPKLGNLPSDEGQVWREYDIRSFTNRLRNQEKPEQTLIDWVLRETGTNTWFGEPMGVLSANRDVVRVYHTPQVQAIVKEVVDRFLNTRSEANEVAVRLVTVDSPNWRVKALPMLTPVQTKTPGLEAWLMSRENAALLIHDLSQRADYRDHNTPNLTIYSGQTHTVKSTRPRMFSVGIPRTNAQSPGVPEIGQIDEGFSLQISPLVSLDGDSIEAVIKCSVDQIERFTPLWVSSVDQFGMLKRSQIKVPQVSSWQLHERFRWPTNEVLLVSRGLVATPGPEPPNGTLRRIFDGGAPRANALLFLESRSEVKSARRRTNMASRTNAANYRGRY